MGNTARNTSAWQFTAKGPEHPDLEWHRIAESDASGTKFKTYCGTRAPLVGASLFRSDPPPAELGKVCGACTEAKDAEDADNAAEAEDDTPPPPPPRKAPAKSRKR